MNFFKFIIKRPVAVLMCVAAVLILGGVSLSRLTFDLMPKIELPMAVVYATYPGAGPLETESMVSRPLEGALAAVSGIDDIVSSSNRGYAVVRCYFNNGTDMDFAMLEMREKLDLVKGYLPDGVSDPVVLKLDPSILPVGICGITSKAGMRDAELYDFVRKYVGTRFEAVEGIASVSYSGGSERIIKITVDDYKMGVHGLTQSMISQFLAANNISVPTGTAVIAGTTLSMNVDGRFISASAIGDMTLPCPNGTTVKLGEIANIEDADEKNGFTRKNGNNAIGLSLMKQTGYNTLATVKSVKKVITELADEHPDLEISLIFDQGEFIDKSVRTMANMGISGGLLAVLILILFLKSWRPTLIVAVSIPFSIVATFVIIYFSGITLNIVSLGGLALGIGMLVDSSIVVIENIMRHKSMGKPLTEAIVEATYEISGAVIASTLTTVGVFLPIVFTSGITSEIFKELALTVSFSLLASLVVSVTLIPVMANKLIKNKREHTTSRFFRVWDHILSSITKRYRLILNAVLDRKVRTTAFAIVAGLMGLVFIPFTGMEFFASIDQGMFTIDVSVPRGGDISGRLELIERLEKDICAYSDVTSVFVQTGSGSLLGLGTSNSTASFTVSLKPRAERTMKVSDIISELKSKYDGEVGTAINFTESDMQGMELVTGGSEITLRIYGPELERLYSFTDEIVGVLSELNGFTDIRTSMDRAGNEIRLRVRENEAAKYGLTSYAIAAALKSELAYTTVSQLRENGVDVNIAVRYDQKNVDKNNIDTLYSFMVDTARGKIPLTEVADIEYVQLPLSVDHEGLQRYIEITADYSLSGLDTKRAGETVEAALNKKITLDGQYSYKLGGGYKMLNEAYDQLKLALVLAVIIVYIIMAAQFESLLQPFIIMFSLPFAFSGAFYVLGILKMPLTVPSVIGFIILTGIVVNNAIVLVTYINTLCREHGLSIRDAITDAGVARIRPILMTTLTTVLGLLPLSLGIGESAEMTQSLAIVVMVGLILSTLLTLLFIPILYNYAYDIAESVKKRKKKTTTE